MRIEEGLQAKTKSIISVLKILTVKHSKSTSAVKCLNVFTRPSSMPQNCLRFAFNEPYGVLCRYLCGGRIFGASQFF